MITYFKKKRAESVVMKRKIRAKKKKIAEKELELGTNKLLISYCPIQGGYCDEDCSHFEKGGVFDCLGLIGEFGVVFPKCKLWK